MNQKLVKVSEVFGLLCLYSSVCIPGIEPIFEDWVVVHPNKGKVWIAVRRASQRLEVIW